LQLSDVNEVETSKKFFVGKKKKKIRRLALKIAGVFSFSKCKNI